MIKQEKKLKAVSVLASFATLRSVSESKQYQSMYQLLSEFIKYIVVSNKIHVFTSLEMKSKLKDTFGFDLPEAVVRTASKGASFTQLDHGQFRVIELDYQQDAAFEKIRSFANQEECYIADSLLDYVQQTKPENTLTSDELMKELMAYLLEQDHTSGNSEYRELISKFILSCEKDVRIQNSLNSIREGCVLYIGLNNNITEVGSIAKPITFYLATEVLFGLYGFNGVICKDLAIDFFSLVKKANSPSIMITLSFFPETKKEIDDFFFKAERIVENKEPYWDRPAMKAIVNGCSSSADVLEKKADFYYKLRYEFGISCDEKTNFYSEELDVYNLETMEIDKQYEDGLRFVSHINKLRKGKVASTMLDSRYLYITNSNSVLKMSRCESQKVNNEESNRCNQMCEYASNLDYITNLLWYKLGSSFGSNGYPKNVQVVLKAKSLLSSRIIQQISSSFEKAKAEYESGQLTKEQVASRILVLRTKPTFPEELNAENIDNSLDFTDDYLDHYETESQHNAIAMAEMASELEYMRTKDQQHETEAQQNALAIAQMSKELEEMRTKKQLREDENKTLEAKVAEFEQEREEQRKKVLRRENIKRFAIRISIKVLVIVVLITVFIWIVTRLLKKEPDKGISSVMSIVGLIIGLLVDGTSVLCLLFSIFRKDYEKCFHNKKQESSEIEED